MEKTYLSDLIKSLDTITGGRVITDPEDYANGKNPFVVTKSSNIPGKAVTELPGLVCGSKSKEIRKIAVLMTMTESAIELAGATGVDVMVCHHPMADAANCGGVLLKTYLGLYDIAAVELHEAFHGLHPGIAYLHGIQTNHVDVAYGGIPGNIMNVGTALPEVKTLGDILSRIRGLMDFETEETLLDSERKIRDCKEIQEANTAAHGEILAGHPENPVHKVLHIFPHTGFGPGHLVSALEEHPGIDTVLATISRVHQGHPLIEKARELGLNFICGNSHAMEIVENGLPLAKAIKECLPSVEVVLFRERMSSIPLASFGNESMREYSNFIAKTYLVKK